MDVTSLEAPAARNVGHSGDKEQQGECDEDEIQHGGYQTPVLLPTTHTAPMSAVF